MAGCRGDRRWPGCPFGGTIAEVKWDPRQYLRRADERGRPFLDLLGRVDADNPRCVVDLGCGPGSQTVRLAGRWPAAQIVGVDSSPEMIAAAKGQSSGTREPTGGLTFVVGDIARWRPTAETDVVISNAALHWVPGHRDLIRGWAAALPSGAWLAFQVPGNFGSPSHRIMAELAASPPWAAALAGVLRHDDAVDEPLGYARLLLDCGWIPDVWETTYVHLLPGDDVVLEWVRGTGLRPVLATLEPDAGRHFEAEYAARLRHAYPRRAEGTLFPFRRIFCVGRKP